MPRAKQVPGVRRLSFVELQGESGVSERTLRRWMREGLLPGPLGTGKASYYEAAHLVRARAIDALSDEGLSMRAIRDRLAVASAAELARLGSPKNGAGEGVPVAPAAPSYPASLWEVVELSDALVLLVRADRAGARRLADEIYRHYRA